MKNNKILYPRQQNKEPNIGPFEPMTASFSVTEEGKNMLRKMFEDATIDAYGIIITNPINEEMLQKNLKEAGYDKVFVIKNENVEPDRFYSVEDKEQKRVFLRNLGILQSPAASGEE